MMHHNVVELHNLFVILNSDSLVNTVETWNVLRVVERWAEAVHSTSHTGVVDGVGVGQ